MQKTQQRRTKEQAHSDSNRTRESDIDLEAVDALVDEIDTVLEAEEEIRRQEEIRAFQEKIRSVSTFTPCGCSEWYARIGEVLDLMGVPR
jgi:hypothetical protein